VSAAQRRKRLAQVTLFARSFRPLLRGRGHRGAISLPGQYYPIWELGEGVIHAKVEPVDQNQTLAQNITTGM
jgi:hypothetical protein